MARFFSISSGSSGNCYYIGASGRGLIIDAGISCKAAVSAMEQKNIDISTIDGVLITHEHNDHIKGLLPLLKKIKCPLYASKPTLDYIKENTAIPENIKTCEISEETGIGCFKVKPFHTSHDAVFSVGYRFHTPDGRVITHATDLGYISEDVAKNLSGSDMVILESNYDENMLKNSFYPAYLKKRIKSDEGHLSNNDCAKEALELIKKGTTRFMLAHLSKNNNDPKLAYGATKKIFDENGFVEGRDYALYVAEEKNPGEMITI